MNLGRKTFAAPLAAFALVAGGGIALAASGGGVPTPGGGQAPEAVAHRPADVGKPTAKPTDDPTETPTDKPSASPSPSLTGLCKAYRAGGYAASTKKGHVNPAWSALEDAAGGSANIGSYCDAKLGPAKVKPTDDDSDGPKAKPVKPAKAVKPPKADDDEDAVDDNADVDSDEGGDGGSHRSEHGKH